jgi:hypothetical protein
VEQLLLTNYGDRHRHLSPESISSPDNHYLKCPEPENSKTRCVFRRSPASPSGSNNALGGLVVVRFLAILRHFDAANDHSFYQDSLGHTWENLTEKGWRFLQGNTRFRGKASLRRAACAEFWRDLRALLPEDEGGRLVLFMCQGGQVRCVCLRVVGFCVCECVPACLPL